MGNIFSGLRKIQADLDVLWRFMKGSPSYGWAVVTAVNPLRIRYDGETAPVAGSPSGDTAGLQVGDRVWCQRINRRDIVLVHKKPAVAYGQVTITISPAATGGTATVTLPAGMFTAAPLVHLTKQGPGLAKYVPYVESRSPGSITVGLYSGDGTIGSGSVVMAWQAVEV